MDTPLPRGEHNEFSKHISSEFQRLQDENNRQNHRLDILENLTNELKSLTVSVEKLAVNMENMLTEQKKQDARLVALENRDGENWRKLLGYIVSTVVGGVIAFFFSKMEMG